MMNILNILNFFLLLKLAFACDYSLVISYIQEAWTSRPEIIYNNKIIFK